jgi:NAD(P)-dependent dehydrogenase (short-subunit alcohol dehydrogenase family)
MHNPISTDLTGKVAVVTGAGGVLCSIFSEALAAAGARVAMLDINEAAVLQKAQALRDKGYEAEGYRCDVLDRTSLEAVHAAVLERFGSCDILLNGAGGNNARANTDLEQFHPDDLGQVKTFFDLDQEGVEWVFRLNFTGTLLPTQVFARDMVQKEGCNILNISSMNAYTPLTKIPAYSGAKAAISNFTQWLAVHFAPAGIRVNALAPGFFVTNQNRDLLFAPDGSPTARAGKIIAATPMGRFGEPEELIGTMLFLLNNDAAGFITGVVIPIDGGFSAYSGV